jgi:hypothetical protein
MRRPGGGRIGEITRFPSRHLFEKIWAREVSMDQQDQQYPQDPQYQQEQQYQQYGQPRQSQPMYLAPHRGGLILAFGILGLVVCAFFGIAAWVMGNSDIREMDAGRMDPSGRDLTQAGRICGIVATALLILGAVLTLGFLMIGIASQGHMRM